MSNLPLIAIVSYVFILCLSVFSCVNMSRVQTVPSVSAPPLTLTEQRARRVAAMAPSWPKTPDYRVSFHPLSAAPTQTGGGVVYASYDPGDDYWGLPRNGAYEEVAVYCAACHTLEIVMQQRATQARWAYMLDWMVEEQNMAPLPEQEKRKVLDYLSAHFGSARVNN